MLFLRALVVYPLLVMLFRFLGRGLQFHARPYDLAVQVLIGSAAANLVVMADIELWRAFTALGALAVMHTVVSFLSLYNPLKRVLIGEPVVLVENGRFLKANLIRHQISVEEVTASLREKGYHDPGDVEFALLEASGNLSVIPRSQARPLTPRDLGIPTEYEGISTRLIADGQVDRPNLAKLGLTEEWLLDQVLQRGAAGFEEVFLACLNTKGEIFLVRNEELPWLRALFAGDAAQTTPGLPPLVGPRQPDPRPPGKTLH